MSLIEPDTALFDVGAAVNAGPAAIMMIGLPGSGKSTFVAQLRRRCDVAVLSMDVFRELACAGLGIAYADSMVEPRNAVWDSRNRALHTALTRMLDTMSQVTVAAGRSLVWDCTNLTRGQRQDRFAQSPGYYRVGVHVVVTPELCRAACKAREAITGRPILPEVIDKMVDQFELPQESDFDLLITIPGSIYRA